MNNQKCKELILCQNSNIIPGMLAEMTLSKRWRLSNLSRIQSNSSVRYAGKVVVTSLIKIKLMFDMVVL